MFKLDKMNLYVKWSIIYISFIVFILLSVSLLFFGIIDKKMEDELIHSYKLANDTVVNNYINFSRSVEEEGQRLVLDGNISKLLSRPMRDGQFYYQMNQLGDSLENISSINNFIDEIALYDNKTDNIILNSSSIKAEYIYGDYLFSNEQSYESWRSFIEKSGHAGFYRLVNGDIVYIHTIYNTKDNEVAGTLIMRSEKENVDNTLNVDAFDDEDNIVILYKNNVVYSYFENEFVDYCLEHNENIESDNFMFTDDKTLTFITEEAQIKCFYASNKKLAYKTISRIRFTLFTVLIALALAGVFFAVYMSRIQYKPISAILHLLNIDIDKNGDEIQIISEEIKNLLQQNIISRTTYNNYNKLLMDLEFLRCISDENYELNVSELFEKFHVNFQYKKYVLALVNVQKADKEIWKVNYDDFELIRYALNNILGEMLGDKFNIFALSVKTNSFLFVIMTDDESNLMQIVTEKCEDSVDYMSDNMGAELFIVLSSPFSEIDKLKYYYSQIENTSVTQSNGCAVKIYQMKEQAEMNSNNDAENNRVNEIIKYINDNYADVNMNIMAIADYFDLHPKYISKIFKDSTGTKLKEYIVGVRMQKAYEYLKTDMTVNGIAEKCGYISIGTFIRNFKGYYGMSPVEKRKELNL